MGLSRLSERLDARLAIPRHGWPARLEAEGESMIEKMKWQDWRTNTERVVADLLAAPVSYILLNDELPPGSCDGSWGITWPGMSGMLRQEIGVRWAGPGPALILNVSSIDRSLPSDAEDRLNSLFAMVWGVVAHELAHILSYPDITGCGLSDGLSKLDFFALPAACPSEQPRPAEHGPTFCWLCLHVHHRLAMRGIDVCLVSMIDYEQFGSPCPVFVMRNTIAKELDAMQSLPLARIARLDPPAEFLSLFLDDCRRVDGIGTGSLLLKGYAMQAFFDRLATTNSETVRQSATDWRALVIDVADERPPTESETVVTLARLGKSISDLQEAVAKLQQRRRLVVKIQEAERSQNELDGLAAKERDANADFATAQATQQRAVSPIFARREAIADEQRQATAARDALLRLSIGSTQAADLKTADVALDSMRRKNYLDGERLADLRANLRALEIGGEPIAEPAREVSQIKTSIARLHDEIAKQSVEIKEQNNATERQRARLLEADFVA